ncbi:MAG: hypothetical protein ACJ71D_00260 [Nitrososphaera sp.]
MKAPKQIQEQEGLERVWEHASWLDSDKVREMLNEDLQITSIKEDELQRKSDADKAKLVLSFKDSSFVAIVDEDRRFKKLINRQPFVEKAINGFME